MENDDNKPISDHAREQATGRLGTFAGVFTPSILTILGIILFLRLGYVTGSAGVTRALLILGVANLITIITSLSLAAIATNLKVKSGGDYYLISRTLGYKFGGSLGIVLYFAQSVSVAFYCIGFGEAVCAILGLSLQPAIIAALAVCSLFVLAWLGADYATKFQYVVMFLLVAALVSFYLGGIEQWQRSLFLENWHGTGEKESFWLLFAIFFPAVTGFTQGVSMSGDLQDSGKSLPLGTFLAVGISILVYFTVIIVFAGALPAQVLIHDYQAMQQVAKYGFLVDAGVVAATLSSAMASFLGGPRILQALAADKIFPPLNFFAKGAKKNNNPQRCVVLTGCIALITISLGQLNLIAQIVSMFFLISYGLLNYATYFEADIGSVSFRPRFRFFNKYLSLAGCLLCLAILVALDIKNGMVALSCIFGLYLYLKHRGKPSRWADSSRAHAFGKVRKNLQQMAAVPKHQRDWYPHILAFTNHQETRVKLLQFGNLITGDTGLLSAIRIIIESGPQVNRKRSEALHQLNEEITAAGLECFSKVVCLDDFSSALSIVLQAQGAGPLQANTVLTNWYSKPESRLPGLEKLRFGHNLRTAYRLGYNLVIFHCEESKWQNLVKLDGKRERIDIWWKEENDSSRLMLLFAYLVTRNAGWENAEIRVLATRETTTYREIRESLQNLFEEARIPAKPVVIENMDPETVVEFSGKSGLVFLPFRIKQSRLMDVEGYSLERILPQLPATAMVMAAEEFDLDSEPEEGLAGELAKAMDALYDAEKRLLNIEKDEKKIEKEGEKLKEQLQGILASNGQDELTEEVSKIRLEIEVNEEVCNKIFRKVAKARSRFEEAVEKVKALGGKLDNKEKDIQEEI